MFMSSSALARSDRWMEFNSFAGKSQLGISEFPIHLRCELGFRVDMKQPSSDTRQHYRLTSHFPSILLAFGFCYLLSLSIANEHNFNNLIDGLPFKVMVCLIFAALGCCLLSWLFLLVLFFFWLRRENCSKTRRGRRQWQ